jgi:parallel beta-helix repeat protein
MAYRFVVVVVGVVAVGAAVACGSEDVDPCAGATGRCVRFDPGPDLDERVQEAFVLAEPGDTFAFGPGTFEFTTGLSIDVDDITVRGVGMDESILSFAGQIAGAQGLLVSGDEFTMEDIAVEDAVGDAVKVEGTTGLYFRDVRVEWTRGPNPDNGAYGLYPVQVQNVLIDGCVAIGASDAGIYVGQSRDIIVRNSRAEFNVAGIEIENSVGADVYANTATNNTGGLLVFTLPGLQEPECRQVRVFDNDVYANNTPNFAPPGNIVGKVPQGTGMAMLAAHDVEVFGNRVRDNQTVNFGVISYMTTELENTDPEYDPYPDAIHVHDNEFAGGGDQPVDELGFLLVQGLITIMEAPIVVPDIVFDGDWNPADLVDGKLPDALKVCVNANGDADWAVLDVPNDYAAAALNPPELECSRPALPAVTIPGVE